MNESTFEANSHDILKKIFPLLDNLKITHQNSFSVKLGHSMIVNGANKTSATGRLDILVSYEDKNLAIVELKSPGVNINFDDAKQGVSYARLMTPMPPLVVVSNGEDTEFYKTYDLEPWDSSSMDDIVVRNLFKMGLSCAADDHDDAVKLLLGRSDIWKTIIKNYSKDILNNFEGEVNDFSCPISKKFIIRRKIENELYKSIIDNPIVTLIGAPLSGKTNVVYRLCNEENTNIIPLYINAKMNYGVLQSISNKFSQTLFKQMSPESVRNWIINSLINSKDARFVIIIDELSLPLSEDIKKEIFELIDLNINNKFSMLLVMDKFCFDKISSSHGRPTKNAIGKSDVHEMSCLDDEEFEEVLQKFSSDFHVHFHSGAYYNVEYRNLRILRILAAQYGIFDAQIANLKDKVIFVPSVTSFNILSESWNAFVTDEELQTDLRYLVIAIIEDELSRINDPFLALMSYGIGLLTYESAENKLGNPRLTRLINQGFIQRLNIEDGKAYIISRFPEALSAAAAFYITDILVENYRKDKMDIAYKFLFNTIPNFPYSDLVATLAIFRANKIEPNLLSEIFNKLIYDEPIIDQTHVNSDCLVYLEDQRVVKTKNLEGITFSNWYPWLVLSHIASLEIGDDNGNQNIRLKVFANIGSYNNILMRVDNVPFKEMQGYHTHTNVDGGSFICGKSGIIEPITFAMQQAFYQIPKKMMELCEYAISAENINLLMRLNTAARSTETCDDVIIETCSKEVVKITSDKIAEIMEIDAQSELNNKNVKVIKVGRNKPCPCNSGKKYKKCCGK
jgi:hypothetical protein